MIKEIITNPIALSAVSEELVEGEEIIHIIDDLIDTAAQDYEGTSGLAAIQIGYPKRIFVLKLNGRFIPILNPVITKRFGGQVTKPERCLSVPDKTVKVKRYKRVKLQFNDYRDGKRIEFSFKGFTARVIQHEMDHLNGVTI